MKNKKDFDYYSDNSKNEFWFYIFGILALFTSFNPI